MRTDAARPQRMPPTYQQLLDANKRMRERISNYRRSMKQLQRAHTVTLYKLDGASQDAAVFNEINRELHIEIRELRTRIRELDAQNRALQARHKSTNGAA